jgi:hypothetical protein
MIPTVLKTISTLTHGLIRSRFVPSATGLPLLAYGASFTTQSLYLGLPLSLFPNSRGGEKTRRDHTQTTGVTGKNYSEELYPDSLKVCGEFPSGAYQTLRNWDIPDARELRHSDKLTQQGME